MSQLTYNYVGDLPRVYKDIYHPRGIYLGDQFEFQAAQELYSHVEISGREMRLYSLSRDDALTLLTWINGRSDQLHAYWKRKDIAPELYLPNWATD